MTGSGAVVNLAHGRELTLGRRDVLNLDFDGCPTRILLERLVLGTLILFEGIGGD